MTTPSGRDILLGSASHKHKANLVLQDLIEFHKILWYLRDKPKPTFASELDAVAGSIVDLLTQGKRYEMAGLRDVPFAFLKAPGAFLAASDTGSHHMVSPDEAKKQLLPVLLEAFTDIPDVKRSPYVDLQQHIDKHSSQQQQAPINMPEPKDVVVYLSSETPANKLYDNQAGNKTLFNLAAQMVALHTTHSSQMRVEACLSILKMLHETDLQPEGDEIYRHKDARFFLRTTQDEDQIQWTLLDPTQAALLVLLFVFEVYLEKELHLEPRDAAANLQAEAGIVPPSQQAVSEPTEHDVLFGRGGFTNSHFGNRRFRDIIALHRPDYIRAIKMDKPSVARKIVRGIRYGHPPGRFLKKGEDNAWYDCGDRAAAEKASQALRERSNAEKRQRSALREALRIRREDMDDDVDHESAAKRTKTQQQLQSFPILNYVGTNLAVPLSLGMKTPLKNTVKVNKTKEGEILGTEGLPPNAVDEDGNILVTDYDILCGRGGLTNHHIGNKRFRDIVALHRSDYVRVPKIQKPSVARVIVRAIRNGDPPGRFLRKDEKTGKWYDVGDKKAAEKTSQALREKTHDDGKDKPRTAETLGVLLPSPASYIAAVTADMLSHQPVPVGDDKKKSAEEAAADI